MTENPSTSVQDAFFAYAKDKNGLPPRMLTDFLQKAADYCRLKQSLLGMTDVQEVRKIQQKVAEGKLLRFRFGKDAQTIRNVTQLYYNFVKSYRETKEQPVVPAETSSPAEPTSSVIETAVNVPTQPGGSLPSIPVVEPMEAFAEEHTEEPDKEHGFPDPDAEKQPSGELWVDFSTDSTYLFTKPNYYIYNGERHDVKSWNRLYVEVCSLLFTDHRSAFMEIMNDDIPEFNALAFADAYHYERMRVPKPFAPGYYLESNLDATSIVRKLCGLSRLFDLGDHLQISYRTEAGDQPPQPKSHREINAANQLSEDSDYNWQREGLRLVDFSQDISYAFTQPEAYEYNGTTRRVNKWGKLFADLCGELFEDYHDAFMRIMNGDVPGYNFLAFADEQHKSSMRVARCFAPGYYLESNINATTIIRRIKGLYQLFSLEGKLRIAYRKTDDKAIESAAKAAGEEWILAELKRLRIPYIDNRSLDGCLWIASDMSIPISLEKAAKHGYHLQFKADGCRAYPNRPVFWTKEHPKLEEKPVVMISPNKDNSSLESFRRFLLQKQGLAERTAGNYCTSIRMIEEYIRRNHLDITLMRVDADTANQVISILMSRPDFVKINDDRHHQFSAAMAQYVSFLRDTLVVKDKPKESKERTIIEAVFIVLRDASQPMTFAEINEAILSRGLYQFNTESSINMIRHAVYAHCMTTRERIERREDVIIQTSDAGLNRYQVMDANSASVFLYGKELTPQHEITPDQEPQPESEQQDEAIGEIEAAVLEADLAGITVEALAEKLHAAVLPTKKAVQAYMNLVSIDGKLIHKDAFVDWEDGANHLEAILDKLMTKNNGYVSDSQLYEYARVDMQMFLNDNDMDDQRKVFDMAEHLFEKEGYHGKHYTFTAKMHISRSQEKLASKMDIMLKYARDEGGCFREEDLEQYLQSLGIKTANLRQQMKVYEEPIFLFYYQSAFITAESLGIDDIWLRKIEQALKKLFDDAGDHVVLRDIQPSWFALLPKLPANREWTPLLLQSVLFHYGKQLGAKTIYGMVSQTGDTLNAMVVSQDSAIRTFGDAVISVLLEDGIPQREFEAEELRQLLVQRGLIAGNELIWNMHKAIPSDERFTWDAEGQHVTINV